jgi:murein DD-endopeptidase MepM/ murein hydrolase activator NlpD
MPRKEISVIVSGNYTPSSFRFSLPLPLARVLFGAACVAALAVAAALVLVLSGAYRLTRLAYLERRNRTLEAEFARVGVLRERLQRLEENSRKMAEMLGVELTPPPVNWDSVPGDSEPLPGWVTREAWGSHPLPSLAPVEDAVLSRTSGTGHEAVDLAAASGARVRATADGVVARRASDREYGKYLLLTHTGGYETFYGHLSGWAVKAGDTVLAGQAIGQVGSSGNSTAPHLHFEVRKDGRPVDPSTLIRFGTDR